ncbi:MAG: D-alanine-D-alanine ligase [Acidobacteriota bacterium]|jgi:D-alanine-D-alanine ligase|nr:D-alanine-D-alanine ligase [Acidobacteriota bacterium]
MARIAVAYNDDAERKTHLNEVERLGEIEVIETAHEIASILGATLVAVTDVRAALETLRAFDVVVDLCEGVAGNPRFEMHFALALEMLGIAHTSCDPIAVGVCTDKVLVKRLLDAAGLPTPRWFVRHPERQRGIRAGGARNIVPPAHADPSLTLGMTSAFIVKPSLEDAGIGIDASSVVRSTTELEARVRHVVETYSQPALVEEFIDGRELNQSLFLGRALPPGEVVFSDDLAPHERVVGWKAKWASGSREDLGTVNRTPADVNDETKAQLADLCTRTATLLGIDMYARFDLRQSSDGSLYIVDINCNPDLGKGSGFRKALDAAGVSFPDFLNALIMSASTRRPA